MNKIHIELNQKNISTFIDKLKTLRSDIKEAEKEIVKDLVDNTEKEISNNYAASTYEYYGNSPTIGKTENTAYVEGEQVIYMEFGTGTAGADDGHPIKGDFLLNPYNSGKTIRVAKDDINPDTGINPRRIILDFYKSNNRRKNLYSRYSKWQASLLCLIRYKK